MMIVIVMVIVMQFIRCDGGCMGDVGMVFFFSYDAEFPHALALR